MISDGAGDVDAVSLLRTSVRRAYEAMPPGLYDQAWIRQVLADLAAALAPVSADLEAMAAAQPTGPVAAVLAHLRSAFTHASASHLEQAVSCVVSARETALRLAAGAALGVEAQSSSDEHGDEPGAWTGHRPIQY